MAFPYKVGIAIALSSNHAEVLGALSKSLLGVGVKIKDLENQFGKLGKVIAGALSIRAGEGLFHGMEKAVKAGSELVHQQQLMKISGMSMRDIAEATSKAYQVSAQVQTTTIAENLKHLRELRYAFGDSGTALKEFTQLSKVEAILNNVGGAKLSDQMWPMVKALEEKGLTKNPVEFQRYLENMTKVAIATGGRVTPDQFFQTFLYGRQAMQGWNADFVAGPLGRLIQSFSGGGGGRGGGPGNALMSLYQTAISGQMPRQSAEMFQQLGLLPQTGTNYESGGHHLNLRYGPHGGVHKSLSGTIARFTPGSMKGSQLLQENPYEWVQQVYGPALLKKLGITADGHDLNEDERSRVLALVSGTFRNRTASSIVSQMLLQGRLLGGSNSPFEKDIALQRGTFSIDQAFDEQALRDPEYAMRAFTAQWTSMMQAFGSLMVPVAVRVMRQFTDVFTALAGAMAKHPTLFKTLAVGLGALAGVLVGAGIAAVVAAIGAGGWLIVGIGALVGGLAALTVIAWDKIKAGFDVVVKGISDLAHVLDLVVGKIKGWFSGGGIPKDDGSAWTPGFNPTSFNAAGRAAVGGFHSGGGFTLMPGTGGAPLIPKGMGKLPPSVTHGPGGLGAGSVVHGLSGSRRGVAATVVTNLRAGGMSDTAIAGILANVQDESQFNPSLRHPDQPHWSGEAHYAHGLYQEGGAEWNNYAAWLGKHHPGADWRDPALQTSFLAENLKKNYPGTWKRMQGAHSAGEAAQTFVREYLKPAAGPMAQRLGRYSRGVPGIDHYTGGEEKAFGLHGKALRDHFGYRGRHNPDHPSAAVPPARTRGNETHTHHISIDGNHVATAVTKRLVAGLNGPAKSGRSPDFSAVRPVSI